jgi:hypothetical protein
MKNFKNKLAITGSKTLKVAFIQELESLGYKLNENNGDTAFTSYIQVNQYGGNGTYSCHCNAVHGYDLSSVTVLTLPQDWDLALKLAADHTKVLSEPGKWYFNGNGKTLFLENEKGNYRSGFNASGDWVDDSIGNAADNNLRLATKKEVEEALFNEARKRGFVAGVTIAKTGINSRFTFDFKPINGNFNFLGLNTIDSNGEGHIFEHGKWAEIIPQEVKVNGYTVTKIDSYTVKVGCKEFNIDALTDLCNFISVHGGGYKYENIEWDETSISKVIVEFSKM